MERRRSLVADQRRARKVILRRYNEATVSLSAAMHDRGEHTNPDHWFKTCFLCRALVVRRARVPS